MIDWKKTSELNKMDIEACKMYFDKFPSSHKKVVRICDKCGKEQIVVRFDSYKICGSCVQLGKQHTEETKQKMRDNRTNPSGENHHYWGKHFSEEHKKKIGLAHIGKTGESSPMWGKHHTEETKQKIRDNRPDTSGENNSNWRGGTSFDPYCERFNEKKRREVRNNYDNCDYLTGIHRDICNVTKTGKIRELTVHHVNYDKQQGCKGKKWLLVPISVRHNTMFNKNRSFWEKLILYALKYDKEYYKIKDRDFNILET